MVVIPAPRLDQETVNIGDGTIIGPPLKEEIILLIAYNYEGMNNSMNKFIPPCITIDKNNS